MSKHRNFRTHPALAVTICLLLPDAAFGGKSGKKNFQEWVKYEAQQQWDLAARQFAPAVEAEPGNGGYRLQQ